MGLFDSPFINKVRRNHGLEHATIHVLSERSKSLSLVGRSDLGGFTLYGPVDTAEVRYASQEALRRLRNGEEGLAVHPRCGTVLATTGMLTGIAAFLALGLDGGSRSRFRWNSIPAAILAATLAAVVAQPLGMFLQKQYTTNGCPGNLEIRNISVTPNARVMTHRIDTIQ